MRGQVAGKNPICLLGQKIEGRKEFVVVPTRDGKGLQINKNVPGFPTVHSKDVSRKSVKIYRFILLKPHNFRIYMK